MALLCALSNDIDNINADLDAVQAEQGTVKKNIEFGIEQGTFLSTNGGKSDNNNRVRCLDAISLDNGLTFIVPSTYQICVFYYNSAIYHSSTYEGKTDFLDGGSIAVSALTVPAGAKFVRVALRWKATPNSAITPSDITGVSCYKVYPAITENEAIRYSKSSLSPALTFIIKDGMVRNDIPPNSIYAIKASAHNQYDKIRFSVTKTTDGEYVAIHDTTINALACNPDGTNIGTTINTADCSLAELNQYDWGLKFGSQYAGLQAPMLENCIALATQYNMTIALDLKWTPDQTDVDALSLMLAKYGQTSCLLMALGHPQKLLFKAKCPKFCYLFTGDVSTFNTHISWIQELHTGSNKVYWALRPAGAIPTDEAIMLAATYDAELLYGPVESFEGLLEIGFASGLNTFECRYIENLKSKLAEYTDAAIAN